MIRYQVFSIGRKERVADLLRDLYHAALLLFEYDKIRREACLADSGESAQRLLTLLSALSYNTARPKLCPFICLAVCIVQVRNWWRFDSSRKSHSHHCSGTHPQSQRSDRDDFSCRHLPSSCSWVYYGLIIWDNVCQYGTLEYRVTNI
jgi:hypothetical protein